MSWASCDVDEPAETFGVRDLIDSLPGLQYETGAHPTGVFWSKAAELALRLVAAGRVEPKDDQEWKADYSAPDDEHEIQALAASLPGAGIGLPGFINAVADTMIDEAAAELAVDVRLTLDVALPAGDLDSAPLRLVVADRQSRPLLDLALAVRRGARAWAPLEQLLHRPVPDELELTDDEVGELLSGAAVRLAAAGIDVRWPPELAHRVTTTAVVRSSGGVPDDVLGADRGVALDWQIALDGEPLTESERAQLTESHRPLVRLRGKWVLVGPSTVRRATERIQQRLALIDVLGAVLSGVLDDAGEQIDVVTEGWLDDVRRRLTAPESWTASAPPELRGTLREYQLRGLRWLIEMTSLGLGGCLADDMGLGKTITLLALHLHRQRDPATAGPTLVVCPASLLGNWQQEIERFAPGTQVRRFHGAGRSLERILDEAGNGFVLTTYGTMRVDASTLASAHWKVVVADEAQHVKNPKSGTAAALREIPAAARVGLTGTPVENNLTELWSILDWTTPGLLGSLGAFRRHWADPIESGEDPDGADRLSRLVRPFVLRRRKADPGIAPELPRKTETDQLVSLSPEQAGLYEALVAEIMDQIRASSGMARRGLVMKLLTGLKQICNHPAHFLKETNTRLVGRSGKLELLDELVDTIVAEDGAVLVFTQYVAMARLLERHLASRRVPTRFLHGGTPVPQRAELVRDFQSGAVPVFLLSLKAAGTGLNLTQADHVIHYDRWWNPAVEDQATDRAYRIGQTRPVQAHR